MTVLIVYLTFILLVIVLFIISIYFINDIIRKAYYNNIISKKISKIKPMFMAHLKKKKIKDISEDDIDNMKKFITKRKGLEAFNIICLEYIDEFGYTPIFKDYIDKVLDYKLLLKNNIVRERYRESYILYLLSFYRIVNDESINFSLTCLSNASLYSRNNALRVIQNSKNQKDVIKALSIINKSEYYFNNKIIIDFITEFKGNKQVLNDMIIDSFDTYNLDIKILLIEYFTNIKESTANVLNKMMDLLNNSTNIEIKIAATKYFGAVNSNLVKEIITDNLDSEFWELRAITAKVIENYQSKGLIDKLKDKLRDQNWFVRFNSAIALININKGVEKQEMINSKDKFAREIYIYALFSKNLIDFDEYNKLMNLRKKEVV